MNMSDAKIIVDFASQLYARARLMVLRGAVAGAATGFLVTLGTTSALGGQAGAGQATGISLIIGAIIGGVWGNARAFTLKLQAQTALCQVEIEKHLCALSAQATGAHTVGQGFAASRTSAHRAQSNS